MICFRRLQLLRNPFLHAVSIQPQRFYGDESPCCHFAERSKKSCLDIGDICIERGGPCHEKLIRSFLYNHYWPREPSVVSLWMDLQSEYLKLLTEKYASSGDRLIAFERIKRTNEKRMVGCAISNKIFPWHADELEEWAHYTNSEPDRNRMYFMAHCIRNPNLFKKYKQDCLYEVEVLVTSSEVSGHGVGTSLLKAALDYAQDVRYPLVQVIAVSYYTAKICEKCGMKKEWSIKYSDYIDNAGQRVFFPREPHNEVSIYTKCFDLCKPRISS